jgi:hypothetical protein
MTMHDTSRKAQPPPQPLYLILGVRKPNKLGLEALLTPGCLTPSTGRHKAHSRPSTGPAASGNSAEHPLRIGQYPFSPVTAAGPHLCSQGGGFTLSPPQTGHAEKKAGGGPAWGPPASQGSPGGGLGNLASLPGASVASPRRLAPSQLEGYPVDIWPPKSVAAPWSGPPCEVRVRSLGAWRRLRGVS